MLNQVVDLLAAKGWFDPSRPFEKTIHLLDPRCMGVLLTRRGRPDTYVKFSRQMDLSAPAARWASASHCFSPFVPPFVGHAREGALSLLVTRALAYRELEAGRLDRLPTGSALFADLVACLGAARQAAAPQDAQAPDHGGLIDRLATHFAAQGAPAAAGSWSKDEAMALCDRLPVQPQHANFGIDQLGVASDGRLVVFGWDDFGLVGLPGFDLFTLERSVAGRFVQFFRSRGGPAPLLTPLAAQACESIGLAPADYLRLAPTYSLLADLLARGRRQPTGHDSSAEVRSHAGPDRVQFS